jgi:hypothetical protein
MSAMVMAPALLPYGHVAKAAGLEEWALQRLEQARFRCDVNFREIDGRVFLTVAGVRVLAETLRQHGYATKAHALTVLANQHACTPARSLLAPRPKGAAVPRYAWQNRKDCAG